MICGKVNINIVQGDSYEKRVKLINIEPALVEGIYFSSDKLNFSKKLEYSVIEEKYIFSFTPEETKNLLIGRNDYDITIKFVGDKITTISYRGAIQVVPKINKVGELNGG